jgi:hypothetical protein
VSFDLPGVGRGVSSDTATPFYVAPDGRLGFQTVILAAGTYTLTSTPATGGRTPVQGTSLSTTFTVQ